ncbi:protein-(glutamine-N5) methyltransferase, release factor-specific [Xenococcus sp. PCC 7305]|uniref:peptide chain release factor N(5)-glutamine methyltransferase n=1 Tax=Xenococcus sp. PCC 7305 TaxID=102125 RepID=UPI0002AC4895|nr:peptide chain release factor N(5)-glutamine methyltransferase [Xenococcus sp. PCC 7305]ELS04186.1 protein-(glutamine-N5) methyltransferase, release factor-specific [Xenococcus sp. PCC 7305]
MAQKFLVSGEEVFLWRRESLSEAIASGIPTQELDWLLQEMADLDALSLRLASFRDRDVALTCSFLELKMLWERRIQERVPVQYLAQVTRWRDFKLMVAPGVLIPRPETELIIEIAQRATCPESPRAHWVDLGTGTGAIALGLTNIFPQAAIHAVDSSEVALAIAKENAQLTKLQNRVTFHHGSWWQPISHLKGQITGMVSNPPYIPTQELPTLQPEVFQHEPHLALDGGDDGLDAIRYLAQSAPNYLVSGGIWLIEMMAGQGAKVVNILSEQRDYRDIKIIQDLSQIERFVLAYRK